MEWPEDDLNRGIGSLDLSRSIDGFAAEKPEADLLPGTDESEVLLKAALPSELQSVLFEGEEVEWFQSTTSKAKLSISFVLCVGFASLLLLSAGAALIVTLPTAVSYILFGVVSVFIVICWATLLYRSLGSELDFVTNLRVGKVLFNGLNTVSCLSSPFESITDIHTELLSMDGTLGNLTLFCDASFSNIEFKHVMEVNVLEALLASKVARRPTFQSWPLKLPADVLPNLNSLRQGNRQSLNQFMAQHPDETAVWVHQLSFFQTMGSTMIAVIVSSIGAICVAIALWREVCYTRNSSTLAMLVLLFSVFVLLPLCLFAMTLAMGVFGGVANAILSHHIVLMRRGIFCFPLTCCNRARLFARPCDATMFPIGTHVNRKTGVGKIVFPRAPNLVSSTMDWVANVRDVELILWSNYLTASLPHGRTNKKSIVDSGDFNVL